MELAILLDRLKLNLLDGRLAKNHEENYDRCPALEPEKNAQWYPPYDFCRIEYDPDANGRKWVGDELYHCARFDSCSLAGEEARHKRIIREIEMAYYRDLREYIGVLDKNGKLVKIKREINKDTELQPLVRWQFRGLPEKERKAFLFGKTIDVTGKEYDTPVLIAAHAPSREVYALAMMCQPDEIMERWEQAQLHPIEPRIVNSGPAQEEIHLGDSLLEHGGLEEFPIPISTPGFDNAPYFSAGNWVSRDPDTGIYNVGNYRGMVKGELKVGCSCLLPQHLRMHREKYKEKGIPTMPAAVVIGPTPNIGLVAITRFPYDVSEYDIAGGIAGEPVELVKCQTVDLLVPATAEIVIEGEISTSYLEREGPFGEYTGYIGRGRPTLFLDITCITHRKQPIWNAFISQFPPSESSLLTRLGYESAFYKFLKYDLSLPNLADVGFHEESGGRQFCVISLKQPTQPEAWKALNGAVALMPSYGKVIIAVDDDIDPRDADSVIWALCYRMQPDRDIRTTPGKVIALDPSIAFSEEIRSKSERPAGSAVMVNATRKWDYPPVSLPKREFMERAKQIWDEEGLPPLTPKIPWHGYSLGYWTEEDEEEAELALKGQHYMTGDKLAKNRTKG
jgi:4-hydroxy-3-polyprenylbenzoate decarboxylase